ncbi:MAG: YraN family protein [Christensenellaceae bacterium]
MKAEGCKILHKNYRTPFGEADLIVEDKDEVAFVEVKTRTSDAYGRPSDAVVSAKQRRYRRIARFIVKRAGAQRALRRGGVWADGRWSIINTPSEKLFLEGKSMSAEKAFVNLKQ